MKKTTTKTKKTPARAVDKNLAQVKTLPTKRDRQLAQLAMSIHATAAQLEGELATFFPRSKALEAFRSIALESKRLGRLIGIDLVAESMGE